MGKGLGVFVILASLAGCTRLGFSELPIPSTDGANRDASTDTAPTADARSDSTLEVDADGATSDDGDTGNRDGSSDGQPVATDGGNAGPRTGPNGEALTFLWATTNALAFNWTCVTPPPADAVVCYAPRADPQSRTCLTGAEDPRLLAPQCDRNNVSVIYELQPETSYQVSFVVITERQRYTLGPLTASTLSTATREVVLFQEEKPSDSWLIGWEIKDDNPHSGEKALQTPIITHTGGENLHLGDVTLAFPGASAPRVATGYLEFALDSPTTSEVCVYLKAASDLAAYCPEDGFVTVDGTVGYQHIQVPLHQLLWRSSGKGIDAATLPNVNGFMVGAHWGNGIVYVDDVSIWY